MTQRNVYQGAPNESLTRIMKSAAVTAPTAKTTAKTMSLRMSLRITMPSER